MHALFREMSYLELNLGLGNILLAAAAAGNLLGLSNLAADGLGAEVLEGVGLGGVDAESRVGLDGSETTRHCQILAIRSPIAAKYSVSVDLGNSG